MGYSFAELHRIAYMAACQQLSERARGQVSTDGDAYRRPGELIDDALALLRQAEQVLRLAVAAERAAATSWQEIGERLDVTRQSAHERFAAAWRRSPTAILFPEREPDHEGGLGWWACPDGLDDPQRTVGELDAWAARHRERSDPERAPQPVSAGPRPAPRPRRDRGDRRHQRAHQTA